MNRKSNPWVALVALILLLAVIVCTCTSCTDTTEAETNSDRFVIEYVNGLSRYHSTEVITDTETGARYLVVYCGNGIGVTPLLPAPVEEVDE